MVAEPAPARRGRRRRNRTEAGGKMSRSADLVNLNYVRVRNPYRPIEQFSADQIEAIHEASLTVLREIGIRVLSDEALAIFKGAGAAVDPSSQRVRFDDEMVLEAVAKASPTVKVRARNALRDMEVGGDNVVFCTVGGPPNISDLENGRRSGTLADFTDLARLAQCFDVIHCHGASVEAMDIETRFRHLEITRALLVETEKVPFVYCRGRETVADVMEMVRIARGIPTDRFDAEPSCYTVVNMNSPLQLDIPMSKGIIDFARRGQLMILTPFTLAGAMAPVSIAGALVQQNAEALAGLALSQLVRPGAPVAYGGFTSNVNMKSGAPAFGTPEYVKAAFASGQLARRYNLPWRSSNANASNAPDAQAAYESQMALWGALMGGCNIVMHGAGWLEGGLTASFEKFIIDVEMLQMFAEMFRPEPCDAGALALDAMREVGPGGHYFGAAHTLERYENAFYSPLLSDWRNFETWNEAGSVDATHRAHAIYKDALKNFERPPMDSAIREELDAFVERRQAEGGANLDD
ncbi:MAG: trimethylamine methyltransferase family protein [Alphaproteobacteria bacterium]|nr:trimethylamine methyltransferase family protein [Alphaproteobacteria bacterium]